jgi:hypothetical protein
MSGGSYDYLCFSEFAEAPEPLRRMAERLAGLPYAAKAAADTAGIVDMLGEAARRAERLNDVWHAIEWWDSGDYGEDEARKVLAAYEAPTGQPTPYEVPDRAHLIDKPVTVTLAPWARSGPTGGLFSGWGEHGISLRLVGGGRWTWWHSEVIDVVEVADRG